MVLLQTDSVAPVQPCILAFLKSFKIPTHFLLGIMLGISSYNIVVILCQGCTGDALDKVSHLQGTPRSCSRASMRSLLDLQWPEPRFGTCERVTRTEKSVQTRNRPYFFNHWLLDMLRVLFGNQWFRPWFRNRSEEKRRTESLETHTFRHCGVPTEDWKGFSRQQLSSEKTMKVRSLICTYHRMNGISKKHISKSSPPESVHGTLFRGRVLADASKLRWGHRDGPRPNNWCPCKGKGRDRGTQAESEDGVGVQKKKPFWRQRQRLQWCSHKSTPPGAPAVARSRGDPPLEPLEGAWPADTLILYFCRSIRFCCFKATQFVLIYYSDYKTLT